jgi:hypothetical protein
MQGFTPVLVVPQISIRGSVCLFGADQYVKNTGSNDCLSSATSLWQRYLKQSGAAKKIHLADAADAKKVGRRAMSGPARCSPQEYMATGV